VEAIREYISCVGRVALVAAAARTLVTAIADAILGAIDRVAEIGRVDLIEESELDDVANSGAQCRPGQRIWIVPGGHHRDQLCRVREIPDILRLAHLMLHLVGAWRIWRRAERHPLLMVGKQDCAAQHAIG